MIEFLRFSRDVAAMVALVLVTLTLFGIFAG